jgi:hypothetical protein
MRRKPVTIKRCLRTFLPSFPPRSRTNRRFSRYQKRRSFEAPPATRHRRTWKSLRPSPCGAAPCHPSYTMPRCRMSLILHREDTPGRVRCWRPLDGQGQLEAFRAPPATRVQQTLPTDVPYVNNLRGRCSWSSPTWRARTRARDQASHGPPVPL